MRVLAAASHAVMRRCLRDALASAVDLEVLAAAVDVDEVLAATAAHDPDVVLLALAVPAASCRRTGAGTGAPRREVRSPTPTTEAVYAGA